MVVVHIVPKKTFENRKWGEKNKNLIKALLKKGKILYFEDLPKDVNIYNNEWQIIRKYLIKLDSN